MVAPSSVVTTRQESVMRLMVVMTPTLVATHEPGRPVARTAGGGGYQSLSSSESTLSPTTLNSSSSWTSILRPSSIVTSTS